MPERYLGRHLGRFRIDSVIGSGGFAWVYQGYDPELDIPVAIKVLKPQYAGDETFEARFRREASTAAKLRHPNIIRILAVGREGEAVYFVMDYLPTGLDERLRVMGTLPEPLLIRLGMEVSVALAFAHREGVIHRDIKTDNILFDEHGNAVVADFGIARATSGYVQQTGTNMVVGTPQYFSPEQARGLPLDGRADIYSLGVTLFKAATGVLPFQGDDWYDIARQHVEEPPPRPRTFNPALSRGLERIILKCLEKDPADRYPTGEALHAELAQLPGRTATSETDATVLMATPITGTPVPGGALPVPPGQRVLHHQRRWAVMSVTGLALAVALIAAAVRLRGDRTPAPPTPAASTHADSTAALARGSVIPGPPPSLPDSLAGTEPAGADTALPTAAAGGEALGRELRVLAPMEAEVRLDGARVGHGRWTTKHITAGPHRVSASVPAVPGCPSARDEDTVRVRESGSTEVTLTPRPCGYVTLDLLPAGARWVIKSSSGDTVAQGLVPVSKPLVLPVGSYTLYATASYCAEYHGDFTVTEAASRLVWARLFCGRDS